ncbi:MAG TPA: CpsD/CapB family tyrosine-protein kinase, partial [Paludibacteraceae bacterium]|nr:CpsD/CapB family tyrosine-protein kinase [Paludibacteraceae bacterium]
AEAEIQKASNSPDNSVLENARIISITNNKEKSKTTTRYLILAFLIPSLIIVLKKSLNNTITSITDIEKKSSFPVIGVVLHTKNDDPLLCAKYPNSLFSEMFRIIRTRIEFIAQRKKNIVVLVTSLTSEDGKTFFSTNLAAIYGMTGEKTLLIDMDIRKPSVNKRLNVSHPKGVTNYLIGECTLPEIINKIDNVNFDIIFAGTVPPNPGELIRSEKLIKMFEELKKQYDYIIIDVSPVGLVSDTYSLVPLSDVNLLVVRNKKTNKTFFKNIATQLMEDHIQNFYVILNDVDTSYGGYEKSYKYHMYDKKTDNKYYDMIDEI